MRSRRFIPSSFLTTIIFLPLILSGPASLPPTAYDWLQFGGSSQHSGNNTQETAISPSTVKSLRQLFQVSLPAVADGAPTYVNSVSANGITRSLLLVTTRDGRLLALDAGSGGLIWGNQVGPGGCRVNNGVPPCYTTSSPAIDPNRQYVYSYGLDGAVHKYRLADGLEITGAGWPETASLKPFDEKGSSSLAIVTLGNGQSYLYAAHGGYPGDHGDYQGHLTVINLATGAQVVFNALCSDQSVHFVEAPGAPDCPQVTAGVWSRAPVVYDPDTSRIYLATGNGDFNPTAHNWGSSVLALNPDGTGANGNPLDSYTPTNYQQLTDADADLGSTAPAILPFIPGSRYPHLAVMGGKDGQLRLLNLDDLSGQGGPEHTGGELAVLPIPQGGGLLTQPAIWSDPQDHSAWVFVTTGSGTSGLRLAIDGAGNPALAPVWQDALSATSPLMVNGVLFEAGSHQIRALDPRTGGSLWNDNAIGGIHWESPIVAGGVLYITDENGGLTSYALQ